MRMEMRMGCEERVNKLVGSPATPPGTGFLPEIKPLSYSMAKASGLVQIFTAYIKKKFFIYNKR